MKSKSKPKPSGALVGLFWKAILIAGLTLASQNLTGVL